MSGYFLAVWTPQLQSWLQETYMTSSDPASTGGSSGSDADSSASTSADGAASQARDDHGGASASSGSASSSTSGLIVAVVEVCWVTAYSTFFMPLMSKIVAANATKSVTLYGQFCGGSHAAGPLSVLSPKSVAYQSHKDSVAGVMYGCNWYMDAIRFMIGRGFVLAMSNPVTAGLLIVKDVVYSVWQFGVKYSPEVLAFTMKAWHPEGRKELRRTNFWFYVLVMLMDRIVILQEVLLLKITSHWTHRLDYRLIRATDSSHNQSADNLILELPVTPITIKLRYNNLCFAVENVPRSMFGADATPAQRTARLANLLAGLGIGRGDAIGLGPGGGNFMGASVELRGLKQRRSGSTARRGGGSRKLRESEDDDVACDDEEGEDEDEERLGAVSRGSNGHRGGQGLLGGSRGGCRRGRGSREAICG